MAAISNTTIGCASLGLEHGSSHYEIDHFPQRRSGADRMVVAMETAVPSVAREVAHQKGGNSGGGAPEAAI